MNYVMVISVFLIFASVLQSNTVLPIHKKNIYQNINSTDTLRSDDEMKQNQIPDYDFLTINNRGSEAVFTTIVSKEDINAAIKRTQFMSAIPPTTITLYNKGKFVENIMCGLAIPISNRKKISKFSKKFENIKQYQRKKTKLATSKKKVYFLEQENEYELIWFEY